MPRPLRVLIVEDIEQDALLLKRALSSGGFDVRAKRVETEQAMRQALSLEDWDVILSDYTLPSFSAFQALETMKSLALDLPFIIVSGTVEEDTAVEAIRAGAHDFLAKGRFARLVPAIEREMEDAKLRAESAEMRQQLLISDRMASIGTLAAGVAHEINNPLTAVIAGVELALQDFGEVSDKLQAFATAQSSNSPSPTSEVLPKVTRAHENLVDVREAAERVRLIVRDLRSFSRADDQTTGPVNIERTIDASIRMVQHELNHRTRLIKKYSDVPSVLGNEARLGQVFLNLIVNAAQSMPTTDVERNELEVTTKLDNERIVVEIRDNGSGIPPHILPRIFDPFFTTKPVGKGTGLGLAICYRIVTELGGDIHVESIVGRGTTFRTQLPIFDAVDSPPSTHPDHATGPAGRVLLIDDEHNVGRMIGQMLAQDHEVTVLTDARDALQLLEQGEHFDAVLCDLMMPEMSGMEFYQQLVLQKSDLQHHVAFMTGGAFTKEAREFLDDVPCHRVEKPISYGAIRALIHALVRD